MTSPALKPQRLKKAMKQVSLKKGDDAVSLAKQYGLSAKDIIRANPNISTYRPGIVINVPAPRQAGAALPTGGPPPDQRSEADAVSFLQAAFGNAYSQQTTGSMAYPEDFFQRPSAAQAWAGGNPWHLGYETELNYARQLNKVAQDLDKGIKPPYITPRMVGSFGLTDDELVMAGYSKQPDGTWVQDVEIGEAAGFEDASGGSSGGSGGYSYGKSGYRRRGYGRGGGGGYGGGRYSPQEFPDYTAGQTGAAGFSMTGRTFDPAALGHIYWRL